MVNLCNRSLHKFTGDIILYCEIKLQIKKNANGISDIVLKTVDQETFLFTRLKAVFTKDK